MFRAGVPLLAGTDTGNPYCFPGFSLHDELALLVDSGLTPLAALQAATLNAAIFMNAMDQYGSITKGKIADLVLLDADPLQDIRNTTKISEVFLSGREFDRAALNRLLKSAEEEANKQQKLAFDRDANRFSTRSSSQSKDDPASFPGQTEGDFIIKDFRFNSGEILPELRLHYVTLGTPHRAGLNCLGGFLLQERTISFFWWQGLEQPMHSRRRLARLLRTRFSPLTGAAAITHCLSLQPTCRSRSRNG